MVDLGWLGGINFTSWLSGLVAQSAHAIDLGWFGYVDFSKEFLGGVGLIIFVNLILSGDNAVIIAMACNKLEEKQRKWGIFLGAGFAVLLRIILTFFAVTLLAYPYLKLVGGALILWIAIKLFKEGHEEHVEGAANIWGAIKTILIADLVMSVDNVLAVAGAAKGNNFLVLFGLLTSVPLVIYGSTLLSKLMQKYPIIITIGAAILGYVGGGMMITDLGVTEFLHNNWGEVLVHPDTMDIYAKGVKTVKDIFVPNNFLKWSVEALFTAGVVVLGKFLTKSGAKQEA